MTEPVWAEAGDARRPPRLRPRIQTLFADLFGLPAEDVAPGASFLELGADSLFLLRASQQLQEQLGARIPFRRLLEELSTVDAVAEHLERELPASEPSPPSPPVEEAQPALPHRPAATVAGPVEIGGAAREPLVTGEPRGELRSIFAEQLRIMERQLELLGRSRPAAPPVARGEDAASAPGRSRTSPSLPPPGPPSRPTSPAPERPVYVAHQPIDRSAGSGLTPDQSEHLDRLVERLAERTRRSKERTQTYRRVLANNRATAGFRLLWKELVYPLIGHRGSGSRIWDVDGNEYVDLTMGFGSLLFGHAPEFLTEALTAQLALGVQIGPESETAGEIAALLCELTGAERATFLNSGTEAVMTAIRLARTVTGRAKVAFFSGSYHGTFDGILARGEADGEGGLRAVPLSPGIPRSLIGDVLVLDYESLDSLAIVEAHAGELAAVLVEPRQSRRPDLDRRDFLRRLREVTERAGIALVFDEVVTGFRMHRGGMQALYDVRADLTTYGKAVANGMPIGVVAGRAAYLDAIDGGFWSYGDRSTPEAETTFFAGTFFRHPLVMAAMLACLRQIRANPDLQEELGRKTARLVASLNDVFVEEGLPFRVTHFGSLFTFTFPPDWAFKDLFFYHLLEKGIYIWERRVCYLSTAHTEEDLRRIVEAVRESVLEMRRGGFLPGASQARKPPALLPFRRQALTEDQRELWELAQMDANAALTLNLGLRLRLAGTLDRAALGRALSRLVDRHTALRIVFDPAGESQEILPSRAVDLTGLDLTRSVDREGEEALRTAAEVRRPFDLTRGPLLRCQLIWLADDLHVLVLTVHHLAADGRSLSILLGELAELYTAELRGESGSLPAPASYERAVETVLAREKSPEMAAHEAFWLRRFSPLPPPFAPPTDHPRPPRRTFRADVTHTRLDRSDVAPLRDLARRLGCTTLTLMLAAIEALLHRMTGQDDLVVGVPAAGHPPDGGPLVGYFLHLLPIRSRSSAATSFADLAVAARTVLLDAHEHRAYPLSRLVRRLGLCDPSRPPLVGALFTLDHPGPLVLPGLDMELTEVPTGTAEFELYWTLVETPESFVFQCSFNTALFDRATVEHWQDGLRGLLARVAVDPGRALRELDFLGSPERFQLLAGSRQAPVPRALSAPIPLTPIQRRFFESALRNRHHWNLTLDLQASSRLLPAALERALAVCCARHDALRLRFGQDPATGEVWQREVEPGHSPPPAWIDLRALPERARQEALQGFAGPLQESLDFEHGPLFRLLVFDLESGRPPHLSLLVHHLAVDLVSLQILAAELDAGYEQAARGEEIRLPPPTTPFGVWARRLEEHAQSDLLQRELGFWLLPEARQTAYPLPLDRAGGENTEGSARVVYQTLSVNETEDLLHALPRAGRALVSEALLTALALTFFRWTGSPVLDVDLEGHGREALWEDVDLGHTVGWMTALYPLRLDLSGVTDPALALERCRRQLRAVPSGGLGFGLFRYLSRRPAAAALAALPQPEVLFNYQGRREGRGGTARLMPTHSFSQAPARSPYGRRGHLFEIDGFVSQGSLQMRWRYSEAMHDLDTVESLVQGFGEALREILGALLEEARKPVLVTTTVVTA